MPRIPAEFFGHTLGWIILVLIVVIVLQRSRPQLLIAVTSHPFLGIGCGWAAGVTTIGVTWGFFDQAALDAEHPDLVAHDIPALEAMLLGAGE